MAEVQTRYTIYRFPTRQVVFEGTYQECWDWMMAQAFQLDNGNRLFRSWVDELGDTYFDVGPYVYIFNGKDGDKNE